MAKYTQLFAEYLEGGGQLPAAFDLIDGFTDLFIGQYCDREIGFETPTLFSIKLNQKADLYIPSYKERIDEIAALRDKYPDPSKIRTKTGEISRFYEAVDKTDTNTKTGEISRKDGGTVKHIAEDKGHITADQPMISTSAPAEDIDGMLKYPTQASKDIAYTDTDETDKTYTETYNDYKDIVRSLTQGRTDRETYNAVTDIEKGYTAGELSMVWQRLDGAINNLKEALLKKFENLFMRIF